ncbi:CBS domain-containing protein [Pikeienuella sp. HZG-20]|uniref:CBS domain-containing protein n=1 Tax=Paludibacillus litoralis TaxID=3133267 RepID=UPI0030EE79F9
MNVQKVISGKKIQSVEIISAQETLAAAAASLASKKIGALIVLDRRGGVAGIISERDIVWRVAAEGATCLTSPVASAMTKAVKICAPTDTVASVTQQMTEGRFRHMPVMDGGRLVGVISIGDVLKARMDQIEMENRAMEDMIRGI